MRDMEFAKNSGWCYFDLKTRIKWLKINQFIFVMYLFTNIFANAIQNLTKKKPKALVSKLGTTIP